MAEPLSLALAPLIGRAEAKKLVAEACQIALQENKHLVDVVRAKTQANLNWESFKDETTYFGSSDAFIDRVLHEARKEPL
jgi:3-carboxy-cis,cis-muconate cycloisomerase